MEDIFSFIGGLIKIVVSIVIGFILLILISSIGSSWDYDSSIQSALSKNKFKTAELINKCESLFRGVAASENSIRILNAKIEYLNRHNEKNSSDMVLVLLDKYPMLHSPYIGTSSRSRTERNNEKYNKEASVYNDFLDRVLTNAIAAGNSYLAQRLVIKYRPIIENETKSFWMGEKEYTYSYYPQEQAQLRLDAAKETLGL